MSQTIKDAKTLVELIQKGFSQMEIWISCVENMKIAPTRRARWSKYSSGNIPFSTGSEKNSNHHFLVPHLKKKLIVATYIWYYVPFQWVYSFKLRGTREIQSATWILKSLSLHSWSCAEIMCGEISTTVTNLLSNEKGLILVCFVNPQAQQG